MIVLIIALALLSMVAAQLLWSQSTISAPTMTPWGPSKTNLAHPIDANTLSERLARFASDADITGPYTTPEKP